MELEMDHKNRITKRHTKTSSKRADDLGVNNYQKKHILNHLKNHGLSKKSFSNSSINFKTNSKLLRDFFTDCIGDAETFIEEEFNSLSFRNINKWLKLLKDSSLQEQCLYEPGIVLNYNGISKEGMRNVDLNEVYMFLGKSLFGQPQSELNLTCSKFLVKEFELLIKEANTAVADYETKLLKQQLFRIIDGKCFDYTIQSHKASVDPFFFDSLIG